MKRLVCALVVAAAAPAFAAECVASLESGKTIDSPRYRVAYRTDPPKLEVGKPFAVDLIVCSKQPGLKLDEVRVDAHMPEHRHGMNYKASVKLQAEPGRYRAEGLMFHMPGHWEFLFDVRDAKGIERLKQDFPLK